MAFFSVGDNVPVILLTFSAGALDLTWAQQNDGVSAILHCWFPGKAMAKIKCGGFLDRIGDPVYTLFVLSRSRWRNGNVSGHKLRRSVNPRNLEVVSSSPGKVDSA